MKLFKHRHGCHWLVLSVLLLPPLLAAGETAHYFDIPAQPLADALLQFTGSSGTRVFFSADNTQNLRSPALKGRYTPQQALRKLLQPSGLQYRYTGPGSITVEPGPAAPPPQNIEENSDASVMPLVKVTARRPAAGGESGAGAAVETLPPVTVTGSAAVSPYDQDYDATDPYNQDYALPNAASGTKTNTPVMETPLNVQVISKQVLKEQQVIQLNQALKNVSGVTTNTTNNFAGDQESILIRGFASQTFFRNGFRLQQGAVTRQMANVESIEVLKGSAAGLYGLVAPGGMVNVITKQPLATPYYGFTQQFGSYDLYRSTLDATGPVTKDKDLLYRVNMSYENSGSFRDFVNKEDVFFAPVLKWNISPRTQATFELEYDHQHSGQDSIFLPLLNGKPLNIPRSRNYGEYTPNTTETLFGSFNWSHQINDAWTIKHYFSVNQQNVKQPKYIFPYDVANGQVSRLQQSFDTQYDTYATNLDLIGHFDTFGLKHTLLFGGDYYRLDTDQFVTIGDTSLIDLFDPEHPGTPFVQALQPLLRNKNQTDQYGFYLQDQIKLPYHIQLMGGIRYQYLHQNNKELIGRTSSAITEDAVTPRVGFLWQPKNWLSLYANYVESFGPNDPFASIYPGKLPPPTSAEQYEGGIKTEFFGGRLRATLAYYDLTKTNIATRDPNHPGFSVITGAVRSRGPELDITGEILPGWNLIASYANMSARVTKSNDDISSPTAVGSRFFNTPRNTGSVWTTYEFLDGDLKGLKFGGGVTLRDGQTGCCDKPAASLPGYATVDLLAAYSLNIGKTKVTAQLNINNLLDKHYYSGLTSNGVGLSGYTAAYADFGQPRTVMGSLQIQY